MTFIQIFVLFFKIAVLTFGGGYAMVPLFQSELVTKTQLMSPDEFGNMIALAQMTPGPLCLNIATYIGYEELMILGALVATVAVVVPSLVLIPIMFYSIKKIEKNKYFQGALKTIRPIILGLISAAVIFFADSSVFTTSTEGFTSPFRDAVMHFNFSGLGIDWIGLIIFLVVLFLQIKTKINMLWTLGICAGLSVGLDYLFSLI